MEASPLFEQSTDSRGLPFLCLADNIRRKVASLQGIQRVNFGRPVLMRARVGGLVLCCAVSLACAGGSGRFPTSVQQSTSKVAPAAPGSQVRVAAAPVNPALGSAGAPGVPASDRIESKVEAASADSADHGPIAPTTAAHHEGAPTACSEGMVRVTHEFCPDLERTCLKKEYERSNHLEICHEFRSGSERCLSERVRLDFCIDRYEFPNQEGGHPPVMVDFHDARARCAALGKRLCYEREWTAACEGPEESPFPYGWTRSSQMCNIDNRWIEPSLDAIYSKNASIRDRELARLDQSVPSGSQAGCRSGFGVHDLTGNFDEWTLADRLRPHAKSKGAALKGGAWGHVRNACRPVTTSHAPEFRYYFVSFRCCGDVRIEQ